MTSDPWEDARRKHPVTPGPVAEDTLRTYSRKERRLMMTATPSLFVCVLGAGSGGASDQ